MTRIRRPIVSLLVSALLLGLPALPAAAAGEATIESAAGGLPSGVASTSISITPGGMAFAADGTLYAADSANGLIWAVTPDQRASVIAGTGLPCTLEFAWFEAPSECRGPAAGEGVPASEVALQDPASLAIGPDGALYFSERRGHVVRRLDLGSGILTTYAGSGERGYDEDHEGVFATEASMYQPQGIAFDSQGALYIADTYNQRLRKVTPDGRMWTAAGCGQQNYPACWSAPQDAAPVEGTMLPYPVAVAVDASDRVFVEARGGLFWIDQEDEIYRHVGGRPYDYPDFAGHGEGGPAAEARFSHITALLSDASGLYLVDAWYNRIQHIAAPVGPESIVSHVAGCMCGQAGVDNRHNGFNGDGRPATRTAFALARATRAEGSIAFDADGNLYLADVGNHRIRRIEAQTLLVSTFAGNGEPTQHGRVYVPMELQPSTVHGGHSGDGGPATEAMLFAPSDVETAPDGTVYFLDRYAHRVRRIATDGTITTVAGGPCQPWVCRRRDALGDGKPATEAVFDGAAHIALHPDGTQLYIGDTYHRRVRQVNLGTQPVVVYPDSRQPVTIQPGEIETVFGGGTCPTLRCAADATDATSASPGIIQGVAVARDGTLYVADTNAHTVVRVDPRYGVVTHVAGVAGGGDTTSSCYRQGVEGLPGRATALCGPTALALGPDNSLYVAETGLGFVGGRSIIRRIDLSLPTYMSTIVAGNGTSGFSGDGGPARQASLATPHGVTVTDDGTIYIADTGNSRIRKVAPDGTITTLAGVGAYLAPPQWPHPSLVEGCEFSGDGGVATSAALCGPTGVAVAGDGSIYIADQVNNRIRVVRPATQ